MAPACARTHPRRRRDGRGCVHRAVRRQPRPPAPAWPWLPIVAIAGVIAAGVLAGRDRTTVALAIALALVATDIAAFTSGAMAPVLVETTSRVRQWMGPPNPGRAISTCENRISAGEMLRNGQPALDGLAGIILSDYQTGPTSPRPAIRCRMTVSSTESTPKASCRRDAICWTQRMSRGSTVCAARGLIAHPGVAGRWDLHVSKRCGAAARVLDLRRSDDDEGGGDDADSEIALRP